MDPNTRDPGILMCFTYSQSPGQEFEWFQPFDHIGSYCNGPCIDPAATLTISSTAPEPATYALIGLVLVAVALKRRLKRRLKRTWITPGAHGGTR